MFLAGPVDLNTKDVKVMLLQKQASEIVSKCRISDNHQPHELDLLLSAAVTLLPS